MNKLVVGIFVVIIGGLIGWYYFKGNISTKNTKSVNPTGVVMPSGVPSKTGSDTESGGVVVTGSATVTYTDTGFNPNRITVKKGTKVTFVNKSTIGMWVASGVYPTHLLLPGFNEQSSVAKSGTYEYTFQKVGTWQYQNDVKTTDKAYVVVTE